jgi:hypothetical protein
MREKLERALRKDGREQVREDMRLGGACLGLTQCSNRK